MIPQVDIQRNADAQKRLEKAFGQNMDDAKIYQEIDRAIGELPKDYGIETVYKWMFLIVGLSVGLIILLCAAGIWIGAVPNHYSPLQLTVMDVKRTKCDQCNKEHDLPASAGNFGSNQKMVSIRLPAQHGPTMPHEFRETKWWDFCNVECLEQFLTRYKQMVAEGQKPA